MIRVKICGVKTLETALMSANAGADMLGLNFYAPSPRSLPVDAAAQLANQLRAELGTDCPLLVGVFANADYEEISQTIDNVGLDLAQISGDEPVELSARLQGKAVKAIRPRSAEEAMSLTKQYLTYGSTDERFPAIIVDAYHKHLYGGSGHQASTEVVNTVRQLTDRMMLAGGLKPENIAARVEQARPWGVDVASGVEDGEPGIKDKGKVQALIQTVRQIEAVL